MEFWPCEHIIFIGGTWRYEEKGKVSEDSANIETGVKWDFCPVCGAKRPSDPRKYINDLIYAYIYRGPSNVGMIFGQVIFREYDDSKGFLNLGHYIRAPWLDMPKSSSENV